MPGKVPREIGKWTCHKIECFADFIEAYTQAQEKTDSYYIELYAGCGNCICNSANCCIDDSELRALKVKTRFARYIFVVRDRQDAENLRLLTASLNADNNIEVVTGNCISEPVIHRLFELIPRSASSFALIDPPGYRRLRWTTIKKLAVHGSDWAGHKMELLIIFPLEMALLRNLMRPQCEASITRLYGNQKWQEIKQQWQEGEIDVVDVRRRLVKLFKAGLKSLGYKYVEDLEPAHFSNPPFYHLIWASDNASRITMIEAAWSKQRYLPCELFYEDEEATEQKPTTLTR